MLQDYLVFLIIRNFKFLIITRARVPARVISSLSDSAGAGSFLGRPTGPFFVVADHVKKTDHARLRVIDKHADSACLIDQTRLIIYMI